MKVRGIEPRTAPGETGRDQRNCVCGVCSVGWSDLRKRGSVFRDGTLIEDGVGMSSPTQTCQVCGAVEVVRQDGRGFPPDAAKRRLATRCKANGHTCQPQYLAGISFIAGGGQ